MEFEKSGPGTKEFYELMDSFEKAVKENPAVRCEIKRADRSKNPSHVFYDNGELNLAFQMFQSGYALHKSISLH